jgi:hypothetical protein
VLHEVCRIREDAPSGGFAKGTSMRKTLSEMRYSLLVLEMLLASPKEAPILFLDGGTRFQV